MNGASVSEHHREQKGERLGFKRVLRRTALFIVFSTVGGLAILFASWKGRHVEVTEGLTLQWLGITEGTNSFIEGNPLEKLLDNRIPAKGLGFGAMKLQWPTSYQPPERDAPITAWVRATGSAMQVLQFQIDDDFKVLTANSAGRELEHPPPLLYRIGPSNEMLFAVSLYAFPRDEKKVRLRLAPPLANRQERRWAEFKFKNPFRGAPEHWEVGNLPVTNGTGNDRFVLFNVLSRPARLIFHAPEKGWYLSACTIWDEEGNRSRMSSAKYEEREIAATFGYPLEFNRAWKVAATFTRAPPTQLLMLGQFTPEDQLRVEVGAGTSYVSVTNSAGVVYNWRFDGQQMSAWNATHPRERPHFVMMSATNELGLEVKFLDTAWSDNRVTVAQVWPTRERSTTLTLEMGVPRTVSTEFYVRPDRVRSK